MKCENCGAEVGEGNRFCPECGTRMSSGGGKSAKKEEVKGTIRLRCKGCGGELTQDEDAPILICPFCGSKELIQESENVTIERIRSRTAKEIEMEKLRQEEQRQQREAEKEQKAEAERRLEKFRKSRLKKWIIAFFILCALFAAVAFQGGRVLAGILALAQAALFGIAWLSGMQIIPEKIRNMHVLAAAAGFLLIVPFFLAYGDGNTRKNETFIWPKSGITEVLPEPKSKKGSVSVYDDSASIYVYKTSAKDFEEYVDACIEKGFTKEADSEGTSYSAFNEEGYELSLDYYEKDRRMTIDLEAPKVSAAYRWPDSEIAGLIPEPESKTGKVEWEYADRFLVYVTGTTAEAFRKYADACSEAGFDVGYERGETWYRADNADGYHLSLEYGGNETMTVRLESPDEEEEAAKAEAEAAAKAEAEAAAKAEAEAAAKAEAEAAAKAEEEAAAKAEAEAAAKAEAEAAKAEEEAAAASSAGTELVDGMRPEIREALDTYEDYMNEYCDFMEKYAESDDTASMLGDYTQVMLKYTEAMEKLDELDEADLNDTELAYYIDVTARIQKRLLEAAG